MINYILKLMAEIILILAVIGISHSIDFQGSFFERGASVLAVLILMNLYVWVANRLRRSAPNE